MDFIFYEVSEQINRLKLYKWLRNVSAPKRSFTFKF